MLKNYSKIIADEYGDKHYLNDEGKFHRLDGPAVERSDGTKFWIINEKTHRNIDPSSEYSNEEKSWRFKNKQHRVGGSFISFLRCWYIHGKEYSIKEYTNIVWDI